MKLKELEKEIEILKKLLFEKGIVLKEDFEYLKEEPYVRAKKALSRLRGRN